MRGAASVQGALTNIEEFRPIQSILMLSTDLSSRPLAVSGLVERTSRLIMAGFSPRNSEPTEARLLIVPSHAVSCD
jgi:hypothetical protein